MRAFVTENGGATPRTFLCRLAATDALANEQAVKVLGILLHEIAGAADYLATTDLSADMKNGLNATLVALANTFSPEQLNSNLMNFLPSVEVSIGAFAMIQQFAGLPDQPTSSTELDALLADMATTRASIESSDFAEIIKSTAIKHMSILETMLRNIDIVGVDAALSAYYDLIIRLRRETTGSPDPGGHIARIWGEVEKWAGRLEILEQIYTHGQTLIEGAEKVIHVLPHLPPLG